MIWEIFSQEMGTLFVHSNNFFSPSPIYLEIEKKLMLKVNLIFSLQLDVRKSNFWLAPKGAMVMISLMEGEGGNGGCRGNEGGGFSR